MEIDEFHGGTSLLISSFTPHNPGSPIGLKSVLVTGAGGSAGHNVCWGIRVGKTGPSILLTGTDSDRTSLELNLWLDKAYHLPRATDREYVAALNRVIEKQKIEALFPQPDSEVGIVSKERARIRTRLFLPDESTVTTCLDKFKALTIWSEAGLRQKPAVLSMNDKSPDETLRKLSYPCWVRAREGAGGLLSCLAPNASIAEHWVKFHWEQGIRTDFVVEEYLPGRDFCFMSIWDRGNLVTSMIRERLNWVGHRLIGSGGTSRLNHIVHSNIVNNQSLKAINAITRSPHGIFCVDLKENSQGTPCPTEINCRFTTNVHYLVLASIGLGHPEWNFPWLAVQLATEDPIPECLKTNALPADLWFTKNTDMGFTMVRGDRWKAIEAFGAAKR